MITFEFMGRTYALTIARLDANGNPTGEPTGEAMFASEGDLKAAGYEAIKPQKDTIEDAP